MQYKKENLNKMSLQSLFQIRETQLLFNYKSRFERYWEGCRFYGRFFVETVRARSTIFLSENIIEPFPQLTQWIVKKHFKQDKFDLSVALDVIEHLPHPKVGIKNIYNLLKIGGTAIFATPNDYPHISNDPTHINVKNPHAWKKILKKVGFKNIYAKQITFIPYFYRFNWRFALVFPFATKSPYLISSVIIIATK